MFLSKPEQQMTKWILLAIAIVILTACNTPQPSSRRASVTPSIRDGIRPNPLFVHLLASGGTPGTAAHRIASTRVYLSQDFSVSVGTPDNPFTNHWDGAVTTPQIGTNGVAKIRPLGSIWNSGDAVLAGRVEWRLGKFFARMQGRNQTTLNYFDGVIELEKPV
jgi:hypothetical protein